MLATANTVVVVVVVVVVIAVVVVVVVAAAAAAAAVAVVVAVRVSVVPSSRDSLDRPRAENAIVVGQIEFCLSDLRLTDSNRRDDPIDDVTMSTIADNPYVSTNQSL